jgi:hypothetical protein
MAMTAAGSTTHDIGVRSGDTVLIQPAACLAAGRPGVQDSRV